MKAYKLGILLASVKSGKAKKWIKGRSNWQANLRDIVDPDRAKILVHAASLGEMEQGLPVLKLIRSNFPKHQIILSFYSPSGYEHFKDLAYCDALIYLPIDTPKEAKAFAEIIKADLALFIKYEIWPNIIRALKSKGCKLILAPANFRKDQIYFKNPELTFFRNALKDFDKILVQNEDSLSLLNKIGINDVAICGDSRFDRAAENKETAYKSAKIETFIDNTKPCLVTGSSWPTEEEFCLNLLDKSDFQLILAPHDVGAENIKRISKQFEIFHPQKLSTKSKEDNSRVLIVDGIGELKYIYRYGDLAFIGGGFGKGVHSTVEAAIYGLPIIFGPNHKKFPETIELQRLGLGRSITNQEELKDWTLKLLELKESPEFKLNYQKFLDSKMGAAETIFEACKELLSR